MKPESSVNPVGGFWCLQYAYREVLEPRLIALSFTVVCVAAVVFTVVGPVGIDDGRGVLERFVLVATASLLCWPGCHALSAAALYLARARPPAQIALACAATTTFMAMPCTAVTYAVYGLLEPVGARTGFWTIFPPVLVLLWAVGSLFHYVACQLVALRNSGVALRGQSRGDEITDHGENGEPGLRDRLFERLPDTLGQDIVYLRVTGHYLNVTTIKGSHLVLMRFADAVEAMGDLGVRVHRSFWVAHGHVVGLAKQDDRTVLRMTGGHVIPVSRTYLASVRSHFSKTEGHVGSPGLD